jgi:hypothetical protein
VVGGGLAINGRGQFRTRANGSNWCGFTGTVSVSSLTGSGAHVASAESVSSIYAPGAGGIFSYLTIFPGAGTITGTITLDRVPQA